MLSIRPPAGVALAQYAVIVQERENRTIVYQSGVQPIEAVAKGRDLNAEPLKIGLKLTKTGTFLIHVRASADTLAPDGVTPPTRTPEYFFATMITANGTVETDVELLQVDPQFDKDFDHFPDFVTWLPSQAAAQARYQGHPELLDCVDNDPSAGDPPLAVPYFAVQINPLAKPVCGLAIDLSCEGKAPVCKDVDGDGDPENLDCDDSDPKRFHGNPRPRNCCQCTDIKSCGVNHSKIADQTVCSPARCDSATDYDCTGRVVPCFVDDDCDGFSPTDSNVSLRDCDDTNPDVHPGAARKCGDTSHDWACDGAPAAGCIPCDVDGDGYQRTDIANGCPTTGYTRPIDCDDNDRGVFPGSTSFEGVTLITRDLKGQEGGGSVAAALRGLCRNQAATFQTALQPQDADCDGNATKGCPTAACDKDGDGYPLGTAGCNPNSLPVDCDDNDAHSFPGAPEKCGDGKPQGCVADLPCAGAVDVDGDGYTSDYDCDDNDSKIHPWAAEICNGVDDDCDGLVDEQNPDSIGNPLVSSYVVGAQTLKGITSCTDDNDGECGKKSVTTGAFSGRCVCSGQASNGKIDVPKHTSCPGMAIGGLQPTCFGATQPTLQTCVASQVKDEDCDGRTDAPDGVKLLEAGSPCGVTTGACVAGTVKGCDRSTSNPFYVGAGAAVSPAFDAERRFLTCNTDAIGPTSEVCDTKDNNCNAQTDETCTEIPGAATPSCCMVSMAPICKDLNSDFNFCGNCNTQCTTVTANQCATGKCKCGASLACSGTNPLCKSATGTCVQCLVKNDCAAITGKPACNTTSNSCVACVDNTTCTAPTGQCDTASNICVQCLNDGNCASPKPFCVSASCVACKVSSDCSAGSTTPTCKSNACVGCAINNDCTGNPTGGLCKTATGACVQCLGNTDCGAASATPSCKSNVCAACTADPDCTGNVNGTHCNVGTGKCVQCTGSAQCATPVLPICNGANACVACTTNALCDAKATTAPKCLGTGACDKCIASTDCNFDTNRPKCTTATGACDKCAANADCATNTNGNKCNAAAGSCGKCTVNADCNYDPLKPSCNATTGQCVPCTSAGVNCTGAIGGNTCNPATGSCVGCVGNSDCVAASATPTCKSNVCAACTADPDCTGNVNGTHCDVGMGKCVQCINSAQCLMSTLPICTADTCVKCPNNMACDTKSTTAPKCNATGDCSKCTASSDCNFDANRPKCTTVTGACDKCAVNSDCSTNGNGNKCNAAMGNCTKCATNADCNYDPLKPSCDAGTGLCMPCTTAGLNCTGAFGGGTVCDTAGKCVQCVGSLDCAGATTPICSAGEMCQMCTNNTECNARSIFTPKCTVGVGDCSKCTVNNDCSFNPAKPVCKPATGDCRACAINAECDGNASGNKCVAATGCTKCTANSDCNFDPLRPSCNATSGLCEPCTNPGRTCTGATGGSVCDAGGKCVQCTASSQCMTAATPICKTEMCMMCTSNMECDTKDVNAPKCAMGVGDCSKCMVNGDCGFDPLRPTCNAAVGNCKGCAANLDCSGNANGNKCLGTGACDKCTVNSDCNFDMTKPTCNTGTGVCGVCNNDAECSGSPFGPACDTVTHQCVSCTSGTYCMSPTTPICVSDSCVICTDNMQCNAKSATTPKCQADGSCAKCLLNTDCNFDATKPYCDTGTGACVPCLTSGQCATAATPICVSDACVACTTNAQCDTKSMTKPKCAGGMCDVCTADADCNFDPARTHCNGAGQCVACTASTQCMTPTAPLCVSNACTACSTNTQCDTDLPNQPVCTGSACLACSGDTDCTVSAARPICDKSGGATDGSCKACTVASMECATHAEGKICQAGGNCGCAAQTDCPSTTKPICTGGVCAKCVANSDCNYDPLKPACNVSGACVGCTSSTQCMGNSAGTMCNTGSGTCECTDGADCTVNPAKPTCDSGGTHTCRGCTSDLECPAAKPTCDLGTGVCS